MIVLHALPILSTQCHKRMIKHFRLFVFDKNFWQAARDQHVSRDAVCCYVTHCSLAHTYIYVSKDSLTATFTITSVNLLHAIWRHISDDNIHRHHREVLRSHKSKLSHY